MLLRRASCLLARTRRLAHAVAAQAEPEAAAVAAIDPALMRLSYGAIDVRVRYAGKRERTRLKAKRDERRIPGVFQGRGEFEDILLDVPLEPLRKAQLDGLLATQKRANVMFSGPPFVLRLHGPDRDALVPEGAPAPELPFSVVRARPVNIKVHSLTELPVGVAFVLAPPERPLRVRVPVRAINAEKCVGLKSGGWINITQRYVDIAVAPGIVPPQFATVDVGGLALKDRLPFAALDFPNKGEGCRVVLPEDTVACVISSV